jgi:uncharacterized metal-binding protein YceD (DUF177 family)
MKKTEFDPAKPFSHLVKVGHISGSPLEMRLKADARELQELATLWGVLSVERLDANIKISRWKRDGARVKGKVTAKVVQACVVSLDPVESEIDEEFDELYVPEGSKLARAPAADAGEIVLDPDGPDMPETFEGDAIDVGAVITEFAALGIDPYPRKPGLDFEPHIEDKAEDDRKPSPFAALKAWKKE